VWMVFCGVLQRSMGEKSRNERRRLTRWGNLHLKGEEGWVRMERKNESAPGFMSPYTAWGEVRKREK